MITALPKFELFLKFDKGCSPNTVKHYGSDIKQFINHLIAIPVNTFLELTPEHFRSFLMFLENAESSTTQRKLSSLRMFFRFMYSERLLLTDLSSMVPKPKRRTKLPKALDTGVAKQVVNSPDLSPRDRALFLLLFKAGLRRSEVSNLDWHDCDFIARTIKVRDTKGRNERIVPMAIDIKETLETLPRPYKHVFHNKTGERLQDRSIYNALKTHCKALGLIGISPHILRHTFATTLLSRGSNLRHIQKLLGHASITTTQVYTQVEVSDLIKDIELLED